MSEQDPPRYMQAGATNEWGTPAPFFDVLDAEFGFVLDAAATAANAKCAYYFTAEDDGLFRSWTPGPVWCNPPYGYGIHRWIRKGYEAAQDGETVVMLIPSRTDTSWWHRYVMRAAEVRLVRGRLRFNGHTVNAPFSSAVVVFRPGEHVPVFSAIDRLLEVPE